MPANRTLALLRALTVTSALGFAVVPRFAVAQTAPATDTTTTTTTTATTTAPTTSPAPNADQEEPTVLSPFVVDASEDKGSYKANSTLAGTRVRTDLNDVASSISVVTAQFLQDTGATNNESLLVYTMNTQVGGLQGNFAGNVAGGTLFQESLESPNTNTRVRGLTGEVTIQTRDFRVRGVDQEVHRVRGAGVLQELGGDNGERGGDVVQVGADAGAGQRAVGLVAAFFLGGINHEGRQDYGFLFRGRCRRRSRGGCGRCRGRRLVRGRRRLCERDTRDQRKTKR